MIGDASRQRRFRGDAGQMAVELAVLIPVVVVVAAIALNALSFMGLCARFDRVAAEAVRAEGTSPGYGCYSRASCESAVEAAIEESLGDVPCATVEVSSTEIGAVTGHDRDGVGLLYSFIPTHRRYSCTLSYTPWFLGSGVFGVAFGPVTHTCEYVVDPFEPQAWL